MIIPLRPRLATALTTAQTAAKLRREADTLEQQARIKRSLADKIDPTCPERRTTDAPGSPTQTEGDPREER